MGKTWQDLTKLTAGKPLVVEKVRLLEEGIAIEGQFELPPLARLTMEDQVFVMAFVRGHGSIKQMEGLFGISYPTVKNRLKRIAEQFELLEFERPAAPPPSSDVLDRLEQGEISAEEAVKLLKQ